MRDSVGGGIINDPGATLILNSSTVSRNGANFGGGISNRFGGATLILNSSTVSGNSATLVGGILNEFGATATVNNSTVSGNAAAFDAGGIFNEGTLTLFSSTVSGNSVGGGRGGPGCDGSAGGIVMCFGATTLKNTIVAGNTGKDCSGGVTSSGNNLDSDGTCGLAGPGDLSGVSPFLGALADNGGPTQTHALLPGSPAIDAGSSDCPPPATDQRGVARPQGTACDIGAFEEASIVIEVTIDIKPGSFPNSINVGSGGTVPVAVFSTDTFDARTVDPMTVTLASASVRLKGKGTPMASFEDVNGDGRLDLVMHVETEALQLSPTDIQAVLEGRTFDGTLIRGTDSIRVVQ